MPFYEESHIQEAVVNWVKVNYPNVLFTCAPANAKSVQQGRRNKRMGYCKGWPDLFFPISSKGYYGLFLELKTESGKVDKKCQQPVLNYLNERGFRAVVCYSYNEAVKIIKEYLDK